MTQPDQFSIDALVGSNIRRLREDRRISQDAPAAALGVSKVQFGKYEAGKATVSAARLATIASFLGVQITDLFEGVVISGGVVKRTEPVDHRVHKAARAFKAIPPECMDTALKIIRLFAQ